MANVPEHLVDKRVQERNIRKGLLDKRDLEQYLKDLPDVGNNAEVLELGGPASDSGES